MVWSCPSRLAVILCLASLLAACGKGAVDTAKPAAVSPRQHDYAREIEALTGAIDGTMRQFTGQSDNVQMAVETATLYLDRARLGGNYDDYRQAQALLDKVKNAASAAPMTCLTQARLHFALHQLTDAQATLGACSATLDPIEGSALRADIAFYSGRYKDAENTYRALVNQVGHSSHYFRLAQYRARTGSPGEAAALLEAAEKRYHGVSANTKAWLKVQRGLLAWERGRLDEALALYLLASDELPGWWLIDEQIAEVKRLNGDTAGAQALLEQIIARTGQPQHMDELARLLREGKTPDAANAWIQRAQAVYRERLKTFPEAGVGHAVDHFLQFGTPAEALDLARRNARLRPFGDAQITLAAALFRAGQAGEAAVLVGQVQESGWDTAHLHAVAAQIYAGLGRRAEADAQRAQALAMNPHAMRLFLVSTPVQPEIVSML